MARLKVFRDGQLSSQHDLDVARELLVGRAETCDVVLAADNGISRQHFRLRYVETQWVVEVLSRFGELYRNGEKQSIFPVKDGVTFTVPPYEFVFEDEAESLHSNQAVSQSSSAIEEDKTHIGYLPSVAYFRLFDHKGQSIQNYRLEGQAWIGGRDTSCSIYIDNPRISRKQFEVQKQDDVYFIRDLGGINGTLLGGRPLSGEDWTPLSSSDIISVADWTLHFELRDAQFEQRLQDVDPALMLPMNYQDMPGEGAGYQGGTSGAAPDNFGIPLEKPKGMKIFGKQVTWASPMRLAIIGILFVGILAHFIFDGSGSNGPLKPQNPFEKLSPEKQQIVKQLYVTAQSLLAQGRYELSRQEVIKLHQIIPYYEDSKQIEETDNQGLAMLQEKEKADAEERQRALTEGKIMAQVEECRHQLKPDVEMAWLESCLAPVMEFNPEHPAIVSLKNQVMAIINERDAKALKDREYAAQVEMLKILFSKAQGVEKKGLPLPAIAAYKKVVISTLPDPDGLLPAAKRRIASLQGSLLARQLEAEKKADQLYHSGQLKQAIRVLREGMQVNPENEVLKGKHTQYMLELRKQMMSFYQEAILEESVGDVEPAKTKWKKIMDQSLPGEDYFEKAKIKLKKYGAL